MSDLISREDAIDAPKRFIKDCNPEHFVGNQKFIEYMDDAEIGSFGNWQFANGFNMGLIAAEVAIEKLPSAQPECKTGRWVDAINEDMNPFSRYGWKCTACGMRQTYGRSKYCPNCGVKMGGKA